MDSSSRPVRVAFVCLGNICRSPTAHAAMQALIDQAGAGDRVVVDSFGTGDWHVGEPSDPRMRAAAAKAGIEIRHRAQHFDPETFRRFDLVLAMDKQNERDLIAMARSADQRAKVRLFRAWDPEGHPGAEVPDPYYGGEQGFDEVVAMCRRTCEVLLAELLHDA